MGKLSRPVYNIGLTCTLSQVRWVVLIQIGLLNVKCGNACNDDVRKDFGGSHNDGDYNGNDGDDIW